MAWPPACWGDDDRVAIHFASTSTATPDQLQSLFAPAPADLLLATTVSKHVNHTDNDDPTCIEEVRVPEQQSMF